MTLLDSPPDCFPGFIETGHREIGEIFAYWNAKRGKREMPARRDIDPVEIPNLLPGIVLVDIEAEEPLKLRYRLVGTRYTNASGFDPTGALIGERSFGRSQDYTFDHYRRVLATRAPHYVNDPIADSRGWWVYTERVFLPLSSDGKRIDMVLVFGIWDRQGRRTL